MKKIYLLENCQWKEFEYTELSDLKSEFAKRFISIGDRASIGYRASIGNEASIGDRASIGNRASIGDRASIGYRASIGDGASIIKSIVIKGSNHLVTFYYTNIIHIGCKKKTIEEWEKEYANIGKSENYSDEQIAEYYNYIQMCKQLQYLEK